MNKVSIGIASLSLALAGAVFAQAPATSETPTATPAADAHAGVQGKMEFSSIDTDKDGRVSKAEAQSHGELTSSFATLDGDSDSYLSQMEFGKWKAPAAPGVTAPESGKTTPAPGIL